MSEESRSLDQNFVGQINDFPLDFEVMQLKNVSSLFKPVWIAFLLLATENIVSDRNGP